MVVNKGGLEGEFGDGRVMKKLVEAESTCF